MNQPLNQIKMLIMTVDMILYHLSLKEVNKALDIN